MIGLTDMILLTVLALGVFRGVSFSAKTAVANLLGAVGAAILCPIILFLWLKLMSAISLSVHSSLPSDGYEFIPLMPFMAVVAFTISAFSILSIPISFSIFYRLMLCISSFFKKALPIPELGLIGKLVGMAISPIECVIYFAAVLALISFLDEDIHTWLQRTSVFGRMFFGVLEEFGYNTRMPHLFSQG